MSDMTEIFGEPISRYTWDDAVNDGSFIDITECLKFLGLDSLFEDITGFALTTNVYCRIIDFDNADSKNINARISRLLVCVKKSVESQNDNYPIFFEYMGHSLIVSMEGRNMETREPVLTIMLAEDY